MVNRRSCKGGLETLPYRNVCISANDDRASMYPLFTKRGSGEPLPLFLRLDVHRSNEPGRPSGVTNTTGHPGSNCQRRLAAIFLLDNRCSIKPGVPSGVTNTTGHSGSNCQRRLAAIFLLDDCCSIESGVPSGVTNTTGHPGSNCHRALPGYWSRNWFLKKLLPSVAWVAMR